MIFSFVKRVLSAAGRAAIAKAATLGEGEETGEEGSGMILFSADGAKSSVERRILDLVLKAPPKARHGLFRRARVGFPRIQFKR